MPYAEVNGTRLYYESTGAGDPVVLIHGLGVDIRIWEHQVAPFARAYTVIRYDTRGHGRSSLPTQQSYSHAADLKALLDHLGIGRAVLIGQSMGGEIAVNFALAYPDQVTALVLVDARIEGYPWPDAWNASWGPIAEAYAATGSPTVVLDHPLHAAIMQNPDAKARLTALLTDYSGFHLANPDPVIVADPPAIQRLHEISALTLVIVGQYDLPEFHAMADILARNIPHAQHIELPGVGHVVPLEAPGELNEIVQRFLAGF